jgi:hypothetical protein
MVLIINETDEVRRKRASSLKTYGLQNQLVIDKFGASRKTFLIKFRDSSCGSAVPLQLGFKMRFSLVK